MIPFRSIYLDDSAVPGRILDIFEPTASSRDVALFFVHGGGWQAGSRTGYHPIALAYRALGFECASTDYRMNGTKVFDQITDVQESLQVFAHDLIARGRRPDIAVIGESAGAHIAALAVLTTPAQAPAYRVTAVCLQATPFTFKPWPDIFPAIWADMQRAIGTPYEADPALYHQASPIAHLRPGLPPIFALHAADEHMFPLDLTEQFATQARELGNTVEIKTYPRVEHGFFYNLDRWQQREAFDDILSFVERTKPC